MEIVKACIDYKHNLIIVLNKADLVTGFIDKD